MLGVWLPTLVLAFVAAAGAGHSRCCEPHPKCLSTAQARMGPPLILTNAPSAVEYETKWRPARITFSRGGTSRFERHTISSVETIPFDGDVLPLSNIPTNHTCMGARIPESHTAFGIRASDLHVYVLMHHSSLGEEPSAPAICVSNDDGRGIVAVVTVHPYENRTFADLLPEVCWAGMLCRGGVHNVWCRAAPTSTRN